MEITTHSPQDSQALAQKILDHEPNIVAFNGELGAGKTTLIQGIGKLLNIDRMTSPTFTIIKQYSLRTNNYELKTISHIDLYRLSSKEEALDLGLEELWADKGNLVLIEWPEIIDDILPPHLEVKIEVAGPDKRKITITQL